MSYKPCQFDKKCYLEYSDVFESDVGLVYADKELTEFNEDAEDLAFELAYTRYKLSKLIYALLPFVSLAKVRDNKVNCEILTENDWKMLVEADKLFE